LWCCAIDHTEAVAKADRVLFVDYESDWVDLLRMAFERAGVPNPVHSMKNGPTAVKRSVWRCNEDLIAWLERL